MLEAKFIASGSSFEEALKFSCENCNRELEAANVSNSHTTSAQAARRPS